MLAMMLAARILGKESYGQLGIVQSSISMFEAIAALGMGTTAIKHIAEYRRRDKAKVGLIILLTTRTTLAAGVTVGIAIYAIAPWLSANVFGSESLTGLIRISALILCFNTVSGGQNGILTGFEAYRPMAYINVLTGAVTIVLVDGGAWYYGVKGALWGLAGVAGLNSTMTHLACRWIIWKESIPKTKSLTRHEWHLLWHFSLPAMLAGLLYAPVNWIGSSYLVRTSGYGEMGLYSAANQWFSILLFIPGIITNVYLPVFADQGAQGNSGHLQRLLTQAIKITVIVALPMSVVVSVASPWIMSLYGESFVSADKLLVLVALSAFVASTQNIVGNALATINLMWVHFASNMVWASAFVITVIGLLELGYKAMSPCLAMLLAYLIKLLFSSVMFRQHLTNKA